MGPRSFLYRVAELCVTAALLAVVAACGGGGGGEPTRTTTTVTITSPTLSPKQGDALQLTAVARDQFGDVIAGTTATWSSSTPTVATVSATGLLQAVAGGTVVVTAAINGVPGALSLTITPRTTTTVTVTSATLSPQAGEALQLAAVARDQFGEVISGTTAVWSSSDTGVATVSPTGLLQTLTTGTVVVTATINGVPGSLALTISPRMTASVTISSPTMAPKEGDTLQLTAVARDQFGNIIPGTIATWSSSDTGIATVSATGLLQTLTTGTVVVTATINGVSGTQALTITAIKVGVTFGAKEVVFDYTTDRCEELDLPDQPARFVRAEDGSLVLIDGNAPRHYVSRGAGFNSLKRDCRQPALVSADRRTADTYENWEWLWVVYREGNRWHALIHNEFHDAVANTCLWDDPSVGNLCWYNSITYAVSTDGGRSFSKPSAPAHVIAPAPYAWAPPLPGVPPAHGLYAEGYFEPSNIVRANSGYYYAFLKAIPIKNWSSRQGLCVFRTDNLDDPASWRAWDGSGFNLRMTSPYVTGGPAPVCTFLDTLMVAGHIVYNTYLNRYMLVSTGQGALDIDGRNVCGFFFSLSADLIHWSKQQLLAEARIGWCDTDPQRPGVLDPQFVLYPSIVDHADTTVNFEKAGQTPYLYYTRFNDGGLNRDLVRVPLTLTRKD